MGRRTRSLLWLVWLCFVGRAAFSSVLLPLWEGFDEWAHAAYIQRLAAGGGLLTPGQTRISREIQASLSLTPLPSSNLSTPHYTHDEYWKLGADERSEMRRELESLPREWAREEAPGGELNYEAQQPPLYYLILAPVQLAAGAISLHRRILLMRLVSLLITSLVIPVGFATVREATGSEGLATATVALLAAMPGVVMTGARLGNDGLAAVLFAALLWSVLITNRVAGWRHTALAGLLLGAGLMTKAYFLTVLAALVVIYGWRLWRQQPGRWRVAQEALVTLAIGCALSGWWYWRNHVLTGSWSGLQQVASGPQTSVLDLVRQAPRVDWRRFLDVSFLSHLWMGNWSFLQLRSWMYHVFAAVALVAVAGVLVLFWRGKAAGLTASRFPVVAAAGFYGSFWLGLAYHELTFSLLGTSSGAGWYLYAVVVAEVLLVILGLLTLCPVGWRAGVIPACTAAFTLLDLYATHFLLAPFYTGLIAHLPSGRLASFHVGQLAQGGFAAMITRVSDGALPTSVVSMLWVFFLFATLALPIAAAFAARSKVS